MDGVLFNKTQTLLIQFPGNQGGNYRIPNSVTSIESYAFAQCASLTGVTIPNGVTSIGDGTFESSANLTNVTIPNSVTSIGDRAFHLCSRLTTVTIPNSVTSIGNSAFADCYRLTSVTIPDSVTSIGDAAFFLCFRLTSVTIPNSVKSIGTHAFDHCNSLTGVYFQANAPSVSPDAFYNANSATIYYLPGTTGWGPTFAGRPTALWQPEVPTSGASFGVRTNQFGFDMTWANGRVIVVEACTNLVNPIWSPVGTNTLTGGASYFSDPQWMNYPGRFYRLRSP
jgi:hypothetical protein